MKDVLSFNFYETPYEIKTQCICHNNASTVLWLVPAALKVLNKALIKRINESY